jgi:hypothetical protein
MPKYRSFFRKRCTLLSNNKEWKRKVTSFHRLVIDLAVEQLQALQEIFSDPVATCNTYPELSEFATKPDFIKKANEIRDDLSKFEK